jgi:hypothetical protein
MKPSKFKPAKYALIESRSSRGVMFGYTVLDFPPIILGSDREAALDYIFALQRGERPDEICYNDISAHLAVDDFEDTDLIAEDDSLTAPEEVEP